VVLITHLQRISEMLY